MFPVGIMASTSAVTGRGENDPIEHALVERGLGPAITLSPLESFNYKPASPDAPAIGLCLLCRVPYVAGDTLLRLPCSHVVHEVCARRRFMDNDACPQCGLVRGSRHIISLLLTTVCFQNVEEMLNARRRSMDSFSLTAAPSSAVSGSTL
ncbi:hypothetical protein BC828DRAFT_386481 [Blastocladiella britannica]|nr:hypothetical protein BC828DRAFT_386481 [Blastocladiella britannica]